MMVDGWSLGGEINREDEQVSGFQLTGHEAVKVFILANQQMHQELITKHWKYV